MNARRTIRIGGASGFWGDSQIALPQLLGGGRLDYIAFDYLAEITMSILARARARDPALGYATDFVELVGRHLPTIAAQSVKLLSNAGGLNPSACADALRRKIDDAGLSLRVGVVSGDDLLDRIADFRECREMASGAPLPDSLVSFNAYLGAFPVAAALDAGADIVITGRCVDSALALGACIHAFGWAANDHDRLAGGSLAGHIIECGAQSTGGLFTDWQTTGDWANIGYPIVEVADDGSFTVEKVNGTGGLVSRGTVAEQLVYEIGDPHAYLLPDVVCDFTRVMIEETGPDRVSVTGARGRAPTGHYKASATWEDGFRVGATWTVIGIDAAAKARRIADAVLRRVGAMLDALGAEPFPETSVEVLGAESAYGAFARAEATREVVLKIAAKHPSPKALELLVREFTSAGTSMAPGFTGMAGNRPKVMPVIRLFSLLVPKSRVPVMIDLDGKIETMTFDGHDRDDFALPVEGVSTEPSGPDWSEVPLIRLAFARSGDKGNAANIGVIARDPAFLPYIRAALTPDSVALRFAHYEPRNVERFDLPGIAALNFLLHDVLGGGGVASLRNDPQGKGYAQVLLDAPIAVPPEIARMLP